MISRQEILELIPHAGPMCLLDSVDSWDMEEIRCTAHSHHDLANPLRSGEMLAAVHGLEYGAQAMAVHGGLLARQRGEPIPGGYLAAVRDLRFEVERLDLLSDPLQVHARCLLVEGGHRIYGIAVQAGEQPVLAVRVTVMEPPR